MTIEELSEALVLLDTSNLPELADIHTRFQSIASELIEGNKQRAADASKACADLVEKIILGEVDDVGATMDVIVRSVSSLQAVIMDDRSPEEVDFPEELNLDDPSPQGGSEESTYRLPPGIDEDILAEFLTKQSSVMEEIENHILALEQGDPSQPLMAMKRLLHTTKGEAGLLHLAAIQDVCHETESSLEGDAAPSVDALLAVKDWLLRAFEALARGRLLSCGRDLIDALGSRANTNQQEHTEMRASEPVPLEPEEPVAEPAAEQAPSDEAAAVEMPEDDGEADGCDSADAISVTGDAELLGEFITEAREHLEQADLHLLALETSPDNKDAINAVFRAFHTIKGTAAFLNLDDVSKLAHEAENLLNKARGGEILLAGRAVDVSLEAVDALRRLLNHVEGALSDGSPLRSDGSIEKLKAMIRQISSGAVGIKPPDIQPPAVMSGKKLGEILVESGMTPESVVIDAVVEQRTSGSKSKLGEMLVRNKTASARDVVDALRVQRSGTSPVTSAAIKEIVKVDAARLDRLVETIGELVIAESMVSQSAELRETSTSDASRYLAQLDKITRELQEMGTSLRMVPIKGTFQKMVRLVRDLAKKADKQVELFLSGEETELDKTVVDRIGDPLVHMVRNAVDHGIEADAQQRRQRRKPDKGRIELRAFHKSGNIHIEIQDDGRGLDRDVILAKGIERGLVKDDEALSDREIYNLIFEPGFSTAKKVTDVSGRGVGMDVVKRSITDLRGSVDIQSELGVGTTFSIRLPLTLAIIDGMLLRVGGERFIIPTLSIVESLRPSAGDISTIAGKGEILEVRDQLMAMFRIGRLFSIEHAEEDPARAIVLVVESSGKYFALLVDELVNKQQIVMKNIPEALGKREGFSGATILGDGSVGLILDVGEVVKLAEKRKEVGNVLLTA